MSQILINDFINELRAENTRLLADLEKCLKLNDLLSKFRLYFNEYLNVCKCEQTIDKSLIEIKIQSLDQQINDFEPKSIVVSDGTVVDDVKNICLEQMEEIDHLSDDMTVDQEVNQISDFSMDQLSESMANESAKRLDCEVLGCDKTFRNKNSLCLHMNRHHKNGKLFQCLKCDNCFRRRPELITHQEIHKIDDRMVSSRDDKTNIERKPRSCGHSLNKVPKDTEDDVSDCDVILLTSKVCPSVTSEMTIDASSLSCSTNETVDGHSHKNGKTFEELMENGLNNQFLSFVRKEIETQVKEYESNRELKRFVCHWKGCEYSTRNNQDLVLHTRRKHTFEKPFRCDQCQKCFQLEKVLNQHKRVHSDIKFKCDFDGCPYQSPYEWDLRAHRNFKHLSKQRFQCGIDDCSKNYKYQADLKSHQKLTHRMMTT